MSVPALAFAFVFDRGWGRLAAPAVALLCLLTAYWDIQWRLRSAQLKPWLATCLLLSLVLTLIGHETNWVEKLAGRPLPVKLDPLASVRGWRETALAAQKVRVELATEGKSLFAMTETIGLAGELSFYLLDPAAVYGYAEGGSDSKDHRFNYFGRKGENAIFIHEVAERGDSEIPFEARLQTQFESTTDLGIREIKYHGQVLRRFHFFACRNLK